MGCLRTRFRKQPIIALYFVFKLPIELELKSPFTVLENSVRGGPFYRLNVFHRGPNGPPSRSNWALLRGPISSRAGRGGESV